MALWLRYCWSVMATPMVLLPWPLNRGHVEEMRPWTHQYQQALASGRPRSDRLAAVRPHTFGHLAAGSCDAATIMELLGGSNCGEPSAAASGGTASRRHNWHRL